MLAHVRLSLLVPIPCAIQARPARYPSSDASYYIHCDKRLPCDYLVRSSKSDVNVLLLISRHLQFKSSSDFDSFLFLLLWISLLVPYHSTHYRHSVSCSYLLSRARFVLVLPGHNVSIADRELLIAEYQQFSHGTCGGIRKTEDESRGKSFTLV